MHLRIIGWHILAFFFRLRINKMYLHGDQHERQNPFLEQDSDKELANAGTGLRQLRRNAQD